MSDQNGNAGRVPKLGDRVNIPGPMLMKGRIIELRGNLGPGGIDVFRVKLANQMRPAYIEVVASQLEFLDDETPAPRPAPSASE